MGLITSIYDTKKLNTNSKELVDVSTGEIFNIEHSNVFQSTKTKKVSIKYDNFVILDTNQIIKFLQNGLKQEDLALLIILSNYIEIESNICFQTPENTHTTASIARFIQCSPQSVKRKLNNLRLLGAIYYGPVKTKGKKVYVINPHIIKKGSKTREDIVELFKKLYKKTNINNIRLE